MSLLSIVTVPFLVVMGIEYFMGSEGPSVSVTSLAFQMFLITAVPVAIGVALRHFASGFADKAEAVLSKVATILFAVIVVAAVAVNWQLFIDNLATLGPALIALNIVLILLGGGLAKVAGLSQKEVKTVAIEAGIQNGTLGILLGSLIVGGQAGITSFSLPSGVYGVTMYLVTIPFALWVARRG